MSGQGKKRLGYPVVIGFMCLFTGSCQVPKGDKPAPGLPAVGKTFRTNGMEEYLSSARAASGRVFLAKNAMKPGVVERPSGLQFLVLKEGKGPCPRVGDSVLTHYKLFTTAGRLIDDSMDSGGPQQFEVDKVIAGWREALQEMRVGAKWRLFLPPGLAYGMYGLANIPGGETLVYELSLLGIKEQAVALPDFSPGRTSGTGGDLSSGRGELRPGGGLVRDNLDLID